MAIVIEVRNRPRARRVARSGPVSVYRSRSTHRPRRVLQALADAGLFVVYTAGLLAFVVAVYLTGILLFL